MSFDVDSLDTGETEQSQGPWISWFANGSLKKGIPEASWGLRQADENGNVTHTPIAAFEKGVVFDLDTLKLGYIGDDGAKGQAPSKRWAPTPNLKAFPNPEPDRQRPQGGAWWQKAVSIRLALSKDQAATWEQAGFSAFEGFNRLVKQIMAEYGAKSNNGQLMPVVKMTGTEEIESKKGNNPVVPILQIVKWAPRPDCLSASGAEIEPGDDFSAPPQPKAPTAEPAKARQPDPVDDDEVPF